MVPNSRYNQSFEIIKLKSKYSIIKASEFFDFLTNDDDVKAKYLGGMNNYNFRQYKDGD